MFPARGGWRGGATRFPTPDGDQLRPPAGVPPPCPVHAGTSCSSCLKKCHNVTNGVQICRGQQYPLQQRPPLPPPPPTPPEPFFPISPLVCLDRAGLRALRGTFLHAFNDKTDKLSLCPLAALLPPPLQHTSSPPLPPFLPPPNPCLVRLLPEAKIAAWSLIVRGGRQGQLCLQARGAGRRWRGGVLSCSIQPLTSISGSYLLTGN